MAENDPFDLARFVRAQAGVFEQARDELAAGTKRSHWMWFIFPQIAGLAHSRTAQLYAIRDLAEARAYVEHSVLGPRLRDCVRAVLDVQGRTVSQIFGSPDDLKFCSSMTLFERAAPEVADFATALDRYCGGRRDAATLTRLGRNA